MEIGGRTAIVTGAASGIGRATAMALAANGARIVVVDIDPIGQRVADEIENAGGEASFFVANVTSTTSLSEMFSYAEATYGGFDILHNNAGVMFPSGFADQPIEAWVRMIEVNFLSVVRATHAAIPLLKRRGGGAILQTASVAGLLAYSSSPIYAASKAAVVSFTRSLSALKTSANIAVNCLCPELVDTPPIQESRLRNRAAGTSTKDLAFTLIPAEGIAAAAVELIGNETLAGQAMKVSPDRPAELLEFPDWGLQR
ncbi:SDR family NAD(P)-dependent oxidoreductase [Bradyrhizobium sp. WSM471]|uniref:SDR family NAD(P)-dependent oxidoreductase n=1 Tax=Bradyrhizobium sp. WSM471 TaxID=319017 RepID=UPI00024D1DC7|nr:MULTISPECIES: SDR family oxidoreductase [Bradyrhizobium]EHR01072.1 short-chain alcohol dehydrogenase [Bradyrhizobium sp. WSM471]UFW43133.1 SDR family oxidoreductase [Bradyrhizobium canariense]